MPATRSLKSLLKRGALLTAANWPIVLAQFVADSLLKLLLGVPIIGGFVLLVLVVGQELPETESLRDLAVGIFGALAAHPAGFAGFLVSLAIALSGGSALTFVVKSGALAVLVTAHGRAGPLDQGPVRWRQLRQAHAATPEEFLAGCRRLWRRFLALGFILLAIYGVALLLYGAVVIEGRWLAPDSMAGWPLLAGLASAALVGGLTLANLFYLLIQMVMAADDVGIRTAAGRVGRYLGREGRAVAGVFLVVLSLVIVGYCCVDCDRGSPGPHLLRAARRLRGLSVAGRCVARSRPRLPVHRPCRARVVPEPLSGRFMNYESFFSRAAESMRQSPIRQMGTVAAQRTDIISLAPGYPGPDSFAWDEYRSIADRVLASRDRDLLQYGPTRGYKPLIGELTTLVAQRHIEAHAEDILVTTGSQQGLDLVARTLLDPGDVVLVELPSYTGALGAFRNAQASLVGVRQDASGIEPDALDATLERLRDEGRRVKFVYVVPNFQNPTGLLMSLERRRWLLEWAAREHVLILEDDPYGALYFEDCARVEDTRPIKADDREGWVIYLSSLSKTLAPGFRTAWVVAPPPLVAKLEIAKQASDLCTGNFDQRIVCEAIRSGVLARHLPDLRHYYAARRSAMEGALRRELAGLLTWQRPRGGFFLGRAPRPAPGARPAERGARPRRHLRVGPRVLRRRDPG